MRIHSVLNWFRAAASRLNVRLEPLQIDRIHYCTKRRSRDSNRNFTRLDPPFHFVPAFLVLVLIEA
jgi:hypothetical protein